MPEVLSLRKRLSRIQPKTVKKNKWPKKKGQSGTKCCPNTCGCRQSWVSNYRVFKEKGHCGSVRVLPEVRQAWRYTLSLALVWWQSHFVAQISCRYHEKIHFKVIPPDFLDLGEKDGIWLCSGQSLRTTRAQEGSHAVGQNVSHGWRLANFWILILCI